MNWEAVAGTASVLVPFVVAFATVFWWIIQRLRTDIDMVKQQLAEHRLHVAENYVTNSELAKAIDGMNKSFSEVFAKLDRLMESKADKDCHR